jgi:hypothetical protein
LTNPIVVWASDLHINSTVALCVPDFELDDGNYHKNSKLQDALYEAWCDGWKQVKNKSKGREVVGIIGGEIADKMSKHPSLQFITNNPDDIRRMAGETLSPMLEVVNKLIVLRGTEAHTGLSSNLDEGIAREIAKDWDVKVIKDGNRFSHYYCRRYIGGRLFDLAHHVSMGTARRGERDAANHLAADLIMDYSRHHELPPDFALRGHVHRHSDSSDNYPVRAIISGAWQMHTAFSHRIGASAQKADIELILIEPDTKKVERINYEAKREPAKYI